jgi:polyferredoxin
MTAGRITLDLWMAGVVLSLISIGLLAVLGAWVCLQTVMGAKSRARRQDLHLRELSPWCSVSELAEIDDKLELILSEEGGRHLG